MCITFEVRQPRASRGATNNEVTGSRQSYSVHEERTGIKEAAAEAEDGAG